MLLELVDEGVNLFDDCLHICDTGSRYSYAACRENFERCFGLNNLVRNSRMKLGLVTGKKSNGLFSKMYC